MQRQSKKDKYKPYTIGLTVPTPTNGLSYNATVFGLAATRDVPLAKNPSTGTAQQRLFLVLKAVLDAVVVISKILRLSTKSRCSRCCRHISSCNLHIAGMDLVHRTRFPSTCETPSPTVPIPRNCSGPVNPQEHHQSALQSPRFRPVADVLA